jgi:hypothetical protein
VGKPLKSESDTEKHLRDVIRTMRFLSGTHSLFDKKLADLVESELKTLARMYEEGRIGTFETPGFEDYIHINTDDNFAEVSEKSYDDLVEKINSYKKEKSVKDAVKEWTK